MALHNNVCRGLNTQNAQHKSTGDSQLAWHHLARDKPVCPWHDNETHTHAQTDVKTYRYQHTMSYSLLRYKEKRRYREAWTLKPSCVGQIPVKRGSTGIHHRQATGSSFHLGNKIGKRNKEGIERGSAGSLAWSLRNIWDRLIPRV